MESTITKLEIEEVEARKKLISIRNKIEKINTDIVLPQIKKQYEGKYFKYRNMYNSEDRWWMYIKIIKVSEIDYFKGFTFQTDNSGEIRFEKSDTISLRLCEVEITRLQFQTAYKKMLNKMDSIYISK